MSWWAWKAAQDKPSLMSPALMPLSVTGPLWRFAELGEEGAVWECRGVELRKAFPSVDSWLEELTKRVRDPDAKIVPWGHAWFDLDPEAPDAPDDQVPIERSDVGAHPDAWRDSAALVAGGRVAPDVTSISAWLASGEASGTVAGAVWPISWSEGQHRVLVLDGTAILDLDVPDSVKGAWLVGNDAHLRRPFQAFEFDVVRAEGDEIAAGVDVPRPPEAVAQRLRLRLYG